MPAGVRGKTHNKVGHERPEHGRDGGEGNAQQNGGQAEAGHWVEEIASLLVEHADVAQLRSHTTLSYQEIMNIGHQKHGRSTNDTLISLKTALCRDTHIHDTGEGRSIRGFADRFTYHFFCS